MEFSRQKYQNGLPFPSSRDVPNTGTEPVFLVSPAMSQVFFFFFFLTTEPSGKLFIVSQYRSFVSLGRFIHRFLTHFNLMANGIVSLIFLSDISLLVISSVTQLCPSLCNPVDCSMPGFPVHHQFLELTQTHVHWVSDAIKSPHPLSSPSPSAFNLSQSLQMSQLLTSGGQRIEASASVLPINIQDWFPLGWTGWISWQSKGLSRVFSNTTVQKHQFFGTSA